MALEKEVEVAKIKFNNKTFWLGILISLVITMVFIFVCEKFSFTYTTTDVIAVFSVFIVISTLFFTSKAYIQAHNKHQEVLNYEKHKFDCGNAIREEEIGIRKKKFTFQITEEWHKPGLDEKVNKAKMFFNKWEEQVSNGDQKEKNISKVLNESPEDRLAVITILNYFEHLCMLMDEDFVDELMIKKSFRFLFKIHYKKTKTFIKQMQDEHNNKSILKHFVKYAKEWSLEG